MQPLINLLGIRRFNYIDTFGISLSIGLWQAGQYIAAIAAFVIVFLISALVEGWVK